MCVGILWAMQHLLSHHWHHLPSPLFWGSTCTAQPWIMFQTASRSGQGAPAPPSAADAASEIDRSPRISSLTEQTRVISKRSTQILPWDNPTSSHHYIADWIIYDYYILLLLLLLLIMTVITSTPVLLVFMIIITISTISYYYYCY